MPIVLTCHRRSGRWTRPRAWLSGQWKSYDCDRGRVVIRYVGKRWWGLTAVEVRCNDRVVRAFPDFNQYEDLTVKKKTALVAGATGPVHLAPMETNVLHNQQSLLTHMATVRYEDGDLRKTGEIRLRPAGTMWVAEALDYDARCMLQCVQATLDDALTGLALLLDQDDAPWQPCNWMKEPPAPRKGKKK